MTIPRDVQEFLDGYPRNGNDSSSSDNLNFYSNVFRCQPDDKLIEEIHNQWFGDYDKLEYKHGFIQWLFPIQEYGMNYQSQPLQKHEIDAMKADPVIIERIIQSYRLMLDFYGMQLVSKETGIVDRVIPPRNYMTRYRNLLRSSHNYLRISRILKCLSEMGLEYLNLGFLLHILNEQSEHGELNSPGLRSSMDRWWANCVRNSEDRQWINDIIKKVRLGEADFSFSREWYERALQTKKRTGKLE
ncbi:opioid growth factor receptor conserved region-domain-containing protein [Cyathus striatus]|nr:opioid growth factor receptor conserved region-domain-containing protein [Cyathus striatus]